MEAAVSSSDRGLDFNPLPPSLPVSKALYSATDSRVNLYDLGSLKLKAQDESRVRKQAESVACLMVSSDLVQDAEGFSLKANISTLSEAYHVLEGFPMAPGVAFRNEPYAALGTVFLIAKDLLLTAAHCVCKERSSELDAEKIGNRRIVFGFAMETKDTCKRSFPKRDVYSIDKIIAHRFQAEYDWGVWVGFSDWALIKLDRDVTQRDPLTLDFSGNQSSGNRLYMIGHPSASPAKYTRNGEYTESVGRGGFRACIDAFRGNSGSPVMDDITGHVVGILCKGAEDYQRVGSALQPRRAQPGERETCQQISGIGQLRTYFAAQADDPWAQVNMGYWCYWGKSGFAKDSSQAMQWIDKASKSSDERIKYALASVKYSIATNGEALPALFAHYQAGYAGWLSSFGKMTGCKSGSFADHYNRGMAEHIQMMTNLAQMIRKFDQESAPRLAEINKDEMSWRNWFTANAMGALGFGVGMYVGAPRQGSRALYARALAKHSRTSDKADGVDPK